MQTAIDFSKYYTALENTQTILAHGRVTNVVGLVIEARGPVSRVGSVCDIFPMGDRPPVRAEVQGFRDNLVLLMPLGDIRGISPGCRVEALEQCASIAVGDELLGRVVNGLGQPIDGQGPIRSRVEYPLYAQPMNPLLRKRIERPLDTGIRAINSLLTIGCGQRMGIFAGSGVGKSTLLGMIARKTAAT